MSRPDAPAPPTPLRRRARRRWVALTALALPVLGLAGWEVRARTSVPSWDWLACFSLKAGPTLPCMRPVAACRAAYTGFEEPHDPPVPFSIGPDGARVGADEQGAPAGKRVAVLGASNVFGLGVRDSETFVVQLAAELRARSNDGSALRNFASPGHDLRQQLRYASELVPRHADLAIATLSEEQLNPSDCAAWAETVTPIALSLAAVRERRLAGGRWRGRNDPAAIDATLHDATVWRRKVGARVPLIVLVLQPLGEGGEHARRLGALTAAGFTLLDLSHELRPVLDWTAAPYRTANREHVNAAGHAAAAKLVAPRLAPLLREAR